MEPLLFFVIKDRTEFGLGLSISRLLQAVVLVCIVVNFLYRGKAKVAVDTVYILRPYIFYLSYVLLVGFLIYFLDLSPSFRPQTEAADALGALNGPSLRPLVEMLILPYQFFYFLVLPTILLRSDIDFDFFFGTLFLFLIFHLTLGYFDFFAASINWDFIPRHIADWRHVGVRWHGIAGEPRDAAAYNMSLLFILYIYSFFRYCRVFPANKLIIIIISIATILTFSLSFLIALLFAYGLIVTLYFGRSSLTQRFIIMISGFVVMAFVIFSLSNVERFSNYFNEYIDLPRTFKDFETLNLPHHVQVSFNNVYPVIFLIDDLYENHNFFPILFGYGIGGSGLINMRIFNEFSNPNSEVVRQVVDYGLVGILLLIRSLHHIIKTCLKLLPAEDKNRMMLAFLIMIGGVMAHRSSVWLVWLGVLCAVSNFQNHNHRR